MTSPLPRLVDGVAVSPIYTGRTADPLHRGSKIFQECGGRDAVVRHGPGGEFLGCVTARGHGRHAGGGGVRVASGATAAPSGTVFKSCPTNP